MVLNLKTTEIYRIVMYKQGKYTEKRILIFTTEEEYSQIEASTFYDQFSWGGSEAEWKIIYQGEKNKCKKQ